MERRLTDADVQALAVAFHQASAEHCRYRTPPDEHDPQHQFIQMMMEREKKREERRQKVLDYVAGSLIVTFTLAFLGFVGHAFLQWLKKKLTEGD